MKYCDYINLGFNRIEVTDSVEYNNSGYYGYYLEKKFTDGLFIGVSSCSLDKPQIYISKDGKDSYHIITINDDMVIDFLRETETINIAAAC